MNKLFKKITALVLAAVTLAGLSPAVLSAGEEDIFTLANDYIKVDVNKANGGFHIDTVKGNKLEKDDDNKLLLHNSGDYDTSFTSLRITRGDKTEDYIFGRSYGFLGMEGTDITTTREENRIVSKWTVQGIEVTQNIELANSASKENGMVIISYTAKVLSGEAADVQMRVLLDTALGYQDFAYYNIPNANGGYTVIERETVLDGDGVYKDMMFGFNDKMRPTITAYTVNGTVNNQACVPSKVAFGHWNNLAATIFDFTPNEQLTFTNEYNVQYLTADSAYALYYDLGHIEPGNSGGISTNYGVYSNAGVADSAQIAINVAGTQPMKLDESKEHYLSADGKEDELDLTVMLNNFRSDSAQDLKDVQVYVYAEDDITAKSIGTEDEDVPEKKRVAGEAGVPAPFVFAYDTFNVGETKTVTLNFGVTPSPNASYRKIEIVAYLLREGAGSVLEDDVVGRQTVYILCPGTEDGVPDVVLTGVTERLYNQGKQRISVSGIHINMLTDKSQYTFKLARISGEGTYDKVYEIPAANVNLDSATNTAELLLPAATDDDGNVIARPLGTYQLIIDYVDEKTPDVVSSAAKIIMTDDIRYSTMGYGVVAVVEDQTGNQFTHRIEVFDNEEDFEKFEAGETIPAKVGSAEKKLGDDDEILMVLKGSFSEERDYNEIENETNGVYYQADVIESNNQAQNPVTVNDSLELRSGYIRAIRDFGDDGEMGGGDDQILVDVDGNMRIAGTGTLVYNGVAAFTAIEDGTDYILRPYNTNGERLTSALEKAEGDGNDDSEGMNTITYIFSKVFDTFVSVGNIVNADFNFAELGAMYKNVGGEMVETTKLVSFSAAIDLTMLVPEGTDEAQTDAGTNNPNNTNNQTGSGSTGGTGGSGSTGSGGNTGGGNGSGTDTGGNTGSGGNGSGTGTGGTTSTIPASNGKFTTEWRRFTMSLKEKTANARTLRANYNQFQQANGNNSQTQTGGNQSTNTTSSGSTGNNSGNNQQPGGGSSGGGSSSSQSQTAGTGNVTTGSSGGTTTPGGNTSNNTATVDNREIGGFPEGAAEVNDILYGGGNFIGLHFTVNIGVPPLTRAMPGIEGTLEVNTMGDWRFNVEGSLEFAKFAMEARIDLIYSQEKKAHIPNSLYLFLEVPPPGLNVDGFGIVWFRGAGGGIDNLYEAVFTPSTLPSTSILVTLSGSLIQMLYMKATLEASLTGISLMAETVTLSETDIEVLYDSGVSFQWIPGFKFTANVHVDFLNVLQGAGYIVVDAPNNTYEFYAQVGVQVPETIPLIGGLEVAQTGVGINTERIWGKITLLGLGFGIIYYWGGDFSFSKADAEGLEPSYPELLSMPLDGPVMFDESSGRTLYASVAPTFTVAAKAQVVENLSAESEIAQMDASAPSASSLKSSTDGKAHVLTFGGSYANKSGALNISFEAESYEQAKEFANQITIKDNNDQEKELKILNEELSNADTANVALVWPSQTEDDGTLKLDENGDPIPADGPQTARIVVSFTKEDELTSGKTWEITTPTKSTVELYDVATLPEFKLKETSIENDTLKVTWDTGAANNSLDKLAVYATTSEDPDDPEAPVTLIGILDPEAEGLSADQKNVITNAFASGSATLTIPASMSSGNYYIKINATLSDTLVDMVTSKDAVTFENPNQPAAPTDITVANAGDYRLRVTETSEGNFDAYLLNVYEQVDGGWQEVSSCSNTIISKGEELVVGGRYAVSESADIEKAYGADLDEPEQLPEYIGLEPGKTYRVGVRKLNYLYYKDTEEKIPDNAMGTVMTDEVLSDSIELKTPTPPKVTVNVAGAKNVSVDGVMAVNETGEEVDITVPTVATGDVTVNVASDMPIHGIWYMDSTSYSAAVLNAQAGGAKLYDAFDGQNFEINFQGLETQEHTLVLVGENEQGDAFTETYRFAVDTIEPLLQITAPTSGSFTGEDGKVAVAGRTDPGAKLEVQVNGGKWEDKSANVGEDGAFSFEVDTDGQSGAEPLMKNTVRIRVTDAAGNTIERVYNVYNYYVNYMEGIAIFADGEDVTGTQMDTAEAITSDLTLKGIAQKKDASGADVGGPKYFRINDDSQVEWTLMPVEGTATLDADDGGNGCTLKAGKYSQGMVAATLSMTDGVSDKIAANDVKTYGVNDAEASSMSAATSFGLNVTPDKPSHQITYTLKDPVRSDLELDTDTARAGDEVTFKITCDIGFAATVKASVSGGDATLSLSEPTIDGNTTTYTFTMPDADVHLDVSLTPTAKHDVTLSHTGNGEVTADPQSALFGETVTVTANPDEGYGYPSVTVTDASGEVVETKQTGYGEFTFTMPNGPVTVMVEFTALENVQSKVEIKSLEDVFDSYPSAIKEKYKSAAEMEEALRAEVSTVGGGDSCEVYDIQLQFSKDGGNTWITADETNFPEDGITVTLPYPEEIEGDWQSYKFTLLHLIVDPLNTGKTSGKIEQVAVSNDENGITFTADCLSPFVLGWAQDHMTPRPSTTVKTEKAANGSFSVSNKYAGAGQTVNITPKADEGYMVDEVIVIDKNGKAVEVKYNGDGTYSFVMPARTAQPVTVKVTFKCDGGENCPSRKFTDVDQNEWYHEGVDFAINNGLMNGTGANIFAPDATTTRAMFVTILYRLEGQPVVTKDVPFEDVPAGQWYSDAINWAAANNIVGGYGDGKFGPEDTITREQMAAILYRYASCKGYDVTGLADLTGYTDAGSVNEWAVKAMQWAVAEGIIKGTSTTTLSPSGDSTRAQIATILMRFCDSVSE